MITAFIRRIRVYSFLYTLPSIFIHQYTKRKDLNITPAPTHHMDEYSMFLDLVGDSPTMRIMQHLIEGRDFDYTLTDLIDAGVSWGTLHTIFPRLVKHKIVIKTREVGRAKLYKINRVNIAAKKLMELYDSLIQQRLEDMKKKKVLIAA